MDQFAAERYPQKLCIRYVSGPRNHPKLTLTIELTSSSLFTNLLQRPPSTDMKIVVHLFPLGTLISGRVLVPRHVSPRRLNENILHSCSKRAFTWRNEVTSVSVFNIVVACL